MHNEKTVVCIAYLRMCVCVCVCVCVWGECKGEIALSTIEWV